MDMRNGGDDVITRVIDQLRACLLGAFSVLSAHEKCREKPGLSVEETYDEAVKSFYDSDAKAREIMRRAVAEAELAGKRYPHREYVHRVVLGNMYMNVFREMARVMETEFGEKEE